MDEQHGEAQVGDRREALGAAVEPLTDDSKRLMQRLESVVTAYGTEVGRYGVGMGLQTVGERHLVGHSGGWPGHITLTLLDPVGKLVVSVLTNAVDGPAEDLVTGLVELVDVALEPRAELGGRLVVVRPRLADPLPGIEGLEVVDAGTLRVAASRASSRTGRWRTSSQCGLDTDATIGPPEPRGTTWVSTWSSSRS